MEVKVKVVSESYYEVYMPKLSPDDDDDDDA